MEGLDQDIVRETLVDRHKFRILVERYQEALLRYIRRLGCSDMEAAKDILQESFIKVYVNLNDYDSAYRIVHNETMSYFRKQKNRPQAVADEASLYVFDTLLDELDVLEEADRTFRSEAIAQALGKLKPQYRDVLVLRFFEEKSYDEIADILRIPQGTVATYIARGKADLGHLLTESKIHEL